MKVTPQCTGWTVEIWCDLYAVQTDSDWVTQLNHVVPRYSESYTKELFGLQYNVTDDDLAGELEDCEV